MVEFLGLRAELKKLEPPLPDFLITCEDGQLIHAEITETTDERAQSGRARVGIVRDRLQAALAQSGACVWVRISCDGDLMRRFGSVDKAFKELLVLVRDALESGRTDVPPAQLGEVDALQGIESVTLSPWDSALVRLATPGLGLELAF